MSGDEHGKRGKATKGKVLIDGMERSDLRPKILVPTPAQLERGERVIDADSEIWPDQVRTAVGRAETHGWAWRVTYSHVLAVPPVTGADAGQWVDTHVLVVRMAKPWIGRAWGCWHGTERLGWKFESAQYWGHFMPRQVNVNATELAGLIAGTMTMKYNEGTGSYEVQKVARPVDGSVGA